MNEIDKLRALEVKPYRITLSKHERVRREKLTMELSDVFRWLMEAGHSRRYMCKILNVKPKYLTYIFLFPQKNITLDKLFSIKELLPDRNLREILMGIAPEQTKAWFELTNDDLEQLDIKLNPNYNKNV